MADDTIYRISFMSQGEIYEIYAKHVSQGGLFGFVEVEDLVFGERTKLVIDSSEERLKNEFEGVRRTFIPMHAVLRVDEVDIVVHVETRGPEHCEALLASLTARGYQVLPGRFEPLPG